MIGQTTIGQTTTRLIVSAALLALGACIFALPNMTRPQILFGVALPEEFRRSASGRRSLRSFRVLTLAAILIAISATWAVPQGALDMASILAALLILLAGVFGFLREHHTVARYAVQPMREQRTAQLSRRPERLPWFMWLSGGPFMILAAAAAFLHLRWAAIPARFPVHWGADGRPDRWSTRSPHGVYGPILFGVELCVLLLVMALATWFGARRSRFRRGILGAMVATEYLIGVLFAGFSTHMLLPLPLALYALGPLVLLIPILLMLRHAAGDPGSGPEPTPNQCWKAGIFYFNANDPALFVEKRFGLGYTVNFANRWSWLLAAMILLVAITAPFII